MCNLQGGNNFATKAKHWPRAAKADATGSSQPWADEAILFPETGVGDPHPPESDGR